MLIQARKYKLISLFIKKDNKPFYAHNFQETEQLKKKFLKKRRRAAHHHIKKMKKGRDPSRHKTLTKHANTHKQKNLKKQTHPCII